jgi:hypothetical protein
MDWFFLIFNIFLFLQKIICSEMEAMSQTRNLETKTQGPDEKRSGGWKKEMLNFLKVNTQTYLS